MYPVESLKTMVRIAKRVERDIDYAEIFRKNARIENPDMTTAISHAACMTAIELKAKAVITVSKSGTTARMVSKYRSDRRLYHNAAYLPPVKYGLGHHAPSD